jgi:hypothetical protein
MSGLSTSERKRLAHEHKESRCNFEPKMRSFVGLAGWYRRFEKDFTSLVTPLYELTKRKKKKDKLE